MQKAKSETEAFQVVIHSDRCQGCGNCVVTCPPNIERSPESGSGFGPRAEDVLIKIVKGQVIVINSKLCNGCGLCVLACPRNAIEIVSLKATPAEAVLAVGEAGMPEVEEMEREQPVRLEEIPFVTADAVERVKDGLDSVAELLKTVRVRFFMELGKLKEAADEITVQVRRFKPSTSEKAEGSGSTEEAAQGAT